MIGRAQAYKNLGYNFKLVLEGQTLGRVSLIQKSPSKTEGLLLYWSWRSGTIRRPLVPKTSALPAALRQVIFQMFTR